MGTMRKSTKWLLFGGASGAAAALAASYGLTVRPWHLRWGATREELAAPMPFDEVIPAPNFVSTRAVTIAASRNVVLREVLREQFFPAGTIVRKLEAERAAVFAPPEPEAEAIWSVMLTALPDGRTRLVSRNRARFHRRLAAVARYLLVDPGQFLFERHWLLGVKERAEAQPAL
jgi:hypothetical protein